MTTYGQYAKDLRALAAVFDTLGTRLPLPHYPDQGLSVDIHVAESADVFQAGRALNAEVKETSTTTAGSNFGTVHLRYVHISAASMTKFEAAESYRRNVVTS